MKILSPVEQAFGRLAVAGCQVLEGVGRGNLTHRRETRDYVQQDQFGALLDGQPR